LEDPTTTSEKRNMSLPSSAPRVVVIGSGFGGLSAARRLARAPVRVTLVDRLNHHVFQPLLYQVATAALSPGDIASPIRWILSNQANTEVLMAEVVSIDLAAKKVMLDRGELPYDFLIVAAGATDAYFGHSEWKRDAPGLKTIADALDIRRRVLTAFEAAEREEDPARQKRLLNFVIVGGGPTGVELAGALAEIARQTLRHDFRRIRPETAHVVLVEAGPKILATFPDDLRQSARTALDRLDVDVRESTRVTGIEKGRVQTSAGEIEAETVIWAAGVQASPLGKTMGVPLDRAGRVIVQSDLTVAGHPEVFVVGDLAAFTAENGTLLPGVAQVAMQEASHAASNVGRAVAGQPYAPFHYRNYGNMATIGRGAAIADLGKVHLSGFIGWLVWLFVHIRSLVGFRNRVVVFGEWAWSFFTLQRRVRLITSIDDTGPPPR
jgi:NADH dehydrogenase